MSSGRLISFLILAITITACAAPIASPPAPPEVLLVQITPSLTWMAASMNRCAMGSGGIGLVVEETSRMIPEKNSLLLHIGELKDFEGQTYVIGQESFAFIINPQNSLDEIDYATLGSIYDGTLSTWDQVGVNAGEIMLWQYPDGMETKLVMEGTLDNFFSPTVPTGIAPNPSVMVNLIATIPNALGYIPHSLVDASVKQLNVIGVIESHLIFPILASSQDALTSAQTEWLGCLSHSLAQ